jgi:LuxR family transcriptional regulator, regulator of acetate metabolism
MSATPDEHALSASEVEERLERLRVLEAVQEAADRLAEAGAVSEIVDRAPAEACRALGLDRCVLSRIDDGVLVAEAIQCGEGAGDAAQALSALQEVPVRLGYPLVEAEMLRRRRAVVIDEPAGPEAAGRHAFSDVMGWGEHVATPIVLEGRVIGFLHGDRVVTQTPLRESERDGLWRFALAFADIFERAVLRRRLRVQRQELRQVASWADARTSELSDGAIDLAVERDAPAGDEPARAGGDAALRDLLTRRELDVLEHMVRGETNADIARALVVSEGTVKFHVKNILRKLHASNRAEATSRYLRLSLRQGEGEGARSLP